MMSTIGGRVLSIPSGGCEHLQHLAFHPLPFLIGRLDVGVAPAAPGCGGEVVLRGAAGRGFEGAAPRTMTSGEDQRIKCVECGEEFLFTAGERAVYQEHNVTHAP